LELFQEGRNCINIQSNVWNVNKVVLTKGVGISRPLKKTKQIII
jgi:hypothetical protein